MFEVTLTGFDPRADLIGPQVESSSQVLEDEKQLEELLHRYLQAKVEDPQFQPRIVIQGQGEDVEIRREGSQLFLYDRTNPNRQGVEVGPDFMSFSAESESPSDSEAEEAPIRLSKDKSGSRLWILILISVLITGVIQAGIFFNSRHNLYTEADFKALSSAKSQTLIETWKGFFVGGFEDQRLGVHIREDETFVVYSSEERGPWEVLETGSFEVVSAKTAQGFQLDSGVFIGILDTGDLDYYGIPLNKMPVPGDLSSES